MKIKRNLLGPLLFLAASTGAEGAGGGTTNKPSGTLEEQLAAARSDLGARDTTISTLTSERDAAISERDALQGQFDAATTEATNAKSRIATLESQITQLTTERDSARTERETAQGHQSRLEKLCSIKGINPSSAVPAAPETARGGHVLDQYLSAKSEGERVRLLGAHGKEIRAEQARRKQEAVR